MKHRIPEFRNYYRRREAMQKALRRATDQYLLKRIELALKLSDESVQFNMEFSGIAKKFPQRYKRHIEKRLHGLQESFNDAKQAAEKFSAIAQNQAVDESFKKTALALSQLTINQSIQLHEITIAEFELTGTAIEYSIQLVPELLFDHIFGRNPSQFAPNTIERLIIFSIGLVPTVGTFLSGAKEVQEAVDEWKNRGLKGVEEADSYLTYLKNYIEALKLWHTYTRWLMGFLNGFDQATSEDICAGIEVEKKYNLFGKSAFKQYTEYRKRRLSVSV